MPSLSDIQDAVAQSGVDPAAMSADGQSVTAQDPLKLMKVEDRVAGRAAATQRRRGIAMSQLIPHGTSPDCGATSDFNARGCG